jgi:hypothetical protein
MRANAGGKGAKQTLTKVTQSEIGAADHEYDHEYTNHNAGSGTFVYSWSAATSISG